MVTRGDICWVELPEDGRRPVLVLTRAEAIPVLRRVIVAPLTKTIREIPTEVRLGRDDGMPDDCVISFDNVQATSRSLLTEPITSLSGPRMHEVCKALAIATGCD
ncbi:MAG TPA: type II toxin-antitoxin system PemK/MazF family toxin [Solirubrobacterales bacterium]|nr:type II toxin-antitoxin system PemK/MazF family toxin [Solirubrobacterales bacterium]